MLPDGTGEATPQGVPQGGPLSPLLANITLDPLDKELERRGHRLARYADDFLVLVKSAKAADRVMASLTRYVEGPLKLVVNRVKSQAAPLQRCPFLGFQIGARGRAVWTATAQARFKRRVKEITRRNRGHRVQDVIVSNDVKCPLNAEVKCPPNLSMRYRSALDDVEGRHAQTEGLDGYTGKG